MAKISAPKGTRDFYPDEMRRRRYLEDVWRRVSLRAGFEEVDGPIFESLELYIQKAGEEIVTQLYNFEDKGGRPIAIRPEFTQSLARMVVARQAALPRPIKWFNISRCCRYERAQKGRLREFFQWNCDILGAEGPAADAECIAVAIDALQEFGLTKEQVEVRLSSRKLLSVMLAKLGLSDAAIPKVYLVLDKRGKVPADVIHHMINEIEMTEDQRKRVVDIMDMSSLDGLPSFFGDDPEVLEQLRELSQVVSLLGDDAAQFVRIDFGIVRGLAYYTGPVWEVFDKTGTLRSLCGGGRYDNLIAASGGKAMPACGFGAGDVTMGLLLDSLHAWPNDLTPRADFYVSCVQAASVSKVLPLVRRLRSLGRSAIHDLISSNIARQIKNADAMGVRYNVVIGSHKCSDDEVILGNMRTHEERTIRIQDLLKSVQDGTI
ncbi:MAG: histidine--tRNA ligase [Phycisphaerae bacterium]|nr:histidine--tRNA ligase [Phycisphaerae bacterium]